MKSLVLKSTLFVAVIVASLLLIASQRQARATLEAEAADLRRLAARLPETREANRRLVAQAAQAAAAPTPAAAASPTPVAPSPQAAEENRDPLQGMVAAEHLRSAGHATPADAFQTVVWAALHGEEALLLGSFSMSDSARAKLTTLLAGMDAEARKKFTTPESIPALLLSGEVLKKILRLHIVRVDLAGEDAAQVHTKVTTRVGRIASQAFPMRRANGKWTLALDDNMIDSMIESLSRKRP